MTPEEFAAAMTELLRLGRARNEAPDLGRQRALKAEMVVKLKELEPLGVLVWVRTIQAAMAAAKRFRANNGDPGQVAKLRYELECRWREMKLSVPPDVLNAIDRAEAENRAKWERDQQILLAKDLN